MGVSPNFADIFQALLNTFCGYNIELISPKKRVNSGAAKRSLYKLISYTSRTFLLLALIPKAFSSHDFFCVTSWLLSSLGPIRTLFQLQI